MIPTNRETTLFERMGGASNVTMLLNSLFDEVMEDPKLEPFFRGVSRNALHSHHLKLFQVLFGPEDEKPNHEDLLDYMFRTHTRLFRENGLDEQYFDHEVACVRRTFEAFAMPADVLAEAMEIVESLRPIFRYGAEVAETEKGKTSAELDALPIACAKTMGTDTAVTLPIYSTIDIPEWLPNTLASEITMKVKKSDDQLRLCAANMTDHFVEDKLIADTILAQSYMDHYTYAVVFFKLAFYPKGIGKEELDEIIDLVLHPLGFDGPKLSRRLFAHMIVAFREAFSFLGMKQRTLDAAVEQLESHSQYFASRTTRVGGATAHHVLWVAPEKCGVEISGVTLNKSFYVEDESALCDNSSGPLSSRSVGSGASETAIESRNHRKKKGFRWSKFLRLMRS